METLSITSQITAMGGRDWEDFAEFLQCVKSRTQPKNAFSNPQAAPAPRPPAPVSKQTETAKSTRDE